MNFASTNDYAKYKQFDIRIAGLSISFISKPGIEDWDRIKASELILFDLVKFEPGTAVAVFGCRHGALPAGLASLNRSTKFSCIISNWISAQCIRQTLKTNNLSNVTVLPYPVHSPLLEESFQAAIILIPKGRNLSRRWILEAASCLEPGGLLFICGANEAGVQSIIKDASELFINSEVLGYKKGERIARFGNKKDENDFPDWVKSKGIAPGTWLEYQINTPEHSFLIHSLPGVFSSGQMDEGTSLLLDHIEVPMNCRILDVGCGYGIVGMAAAKKEPTAQVDMVDVDLMAVASSIENTRLNVLSNVNVFPSDLLSACDEKSYEVILSNPPFHSGKETNYQISEAMIEQAYNHLAPAGVFRIVANRFLRYEKQMENYFSKVFINDQTSKYHIITGVR